MAENEFGRSIATLKEKTHALEERCDDFKKVHVRMWIKFEDIESRLQGRPSWLVCTVITILFGLCTTLLTMLTVLH